MTDIRSSCDVQSVKRYLSEQLEEYEEQQLLAHLDECDACRLQIEHEAAGEAWWTEASDYLTPDEIDREIQATHSGDSQATEANAIHRGSIAGVIDQLSPTDDPHMMGRFGGYEIVGVVGCGGMGVVLKGHEAALNRFVAIKILAPHLATSGAARNRFSREGQSAASVVHPNVVSIHRVSEDNGFPFLVMPYVAGESLQKRIDNQGALSVANIVRIGLQVCRGLAAAHAQGLVHRDVKPGNILLEKNVDRVILTDFGLARAADDASMTKSGVLAGTPQYMSPEQARGERLDQRSDLFSLGSVFYTLCTGRPPFRSETSYGILRKITDNKPRPIREINPDIPIWLVRLINKLHEKSPEKRFDTAAEIADLLEQCLAHLQQPDVQPLPEELRSPARSYLKVSAVAGVLCLSVIVMFFLFGSDQNSTLPIDLQTSAGSPVLAKPNIENEHSDSAPPEQVEQATTGLFKSAAGQATPEFVANSNREESLPRRTINLPTSSPRQGVGPRPYPASSLTGTSIMSDGEWENLNDLFGKVQQLDSELEELDKRLDNETTNLGNTSKKGSQ